MKNIEKYQNLISKGEVDALLLTSKHNRQYAAEYCIAEGVAVICKTQSYYFTDFRYIESAQKNLPGFAVKMVDTEHPYTKLINEAISDNTVKTIGFEDDTLTVEEYTLYNTKLNAVLHPYAAEINAPRASKEPWEIEYMKKAQEITDRTFEDLLNIIHRNGAKMDCELVNLSFASKQVSGKISSANRRKAVMKVDQAGQVVAIYSSGREAAKKNYISQNAIWARCAGKVKDPYRLDGYDYRYETSRRA